jgi:DNA polymerase
MMERDINYCGACSLNEYDTFVPSEGNPETKIWFVGEAPGEKEVKRQRPFIGLTGLNGRNWFGVAAARLGSPLEISEEHMFITNTVWCRPPYNNTPNNELSTYCGKRYLLELFNKHKPKVVLLVGKTAARFFLGTEEKTLALRYAPIELESTTLIHIHHPSYIWRNRHLEEDYINSLMRTISIIERCQENTVRLRR